MGWYEIFKDVLSMAQKADNVELVRQLLAMQKESGYATDKFWTYKGKYET